jgi:tellurite resistance protein TerC
VEHIPLWGWGAFGALVVLLLAIDLFAHRDGRGESQRSAIIWSVIWIGAGLAFNVFVWIVMGGQAAQEYLAAYLIEKSLSLDNLFVFLIIFQSLGIPSRYQHDVLFWGILGAVVMRLAFILVGVSLIQWFEPVTWVFGAFLVYVAYKLARHSGGEVHPEKNIVLKTARRLLPVSRGDHLDHGHAFIVREQGALCFTPLLLVLLVIESTDVIFAIDSVPAVIGIIPTKTFTPSLTKFIAFTSNVFAILGLRALYFLLAGVMEMFRYLHYGLAAVLGFVGLKMILEYIVEEGGHLVSPLVSLLVIAALLGISIAASLIASRRENPPEEATDDSE